MSAATHPSESKTRAWLATLTMDQLEQARSAASRLRTMEAQALRDWIAQEFRQRDAGAGFMDPRRGPDQPPR